MMGYWLVTDLYSTITKGGAQLTASADTYNSEFRICQRLMQAERHSY